MQNHYILLSPLGRSGFALDLGMPLCLLRAFIAFLDLLILPCLNIPFPFIRCFYLFSFLLLFQLSSSVSSNILPLELDSSPCSSFTYTISFENPFFFWGLMSFFGQLSRNLPCDEGSGMLIGWPALETLMGKGRLPLPLGCSKRFSPMLNEVLNCLKFVGNYG